MSVVDSLEIIPADIQTTDGIRPLYVWYGDIMILVFACRIG